MTEANITIQEIEPHLKIAYISGQLDESNIDEKIQVVYKAIEEDPIHLGLIFDLSELTYMNSKSIGYMTDIYGKIADNNGKVVIANAKPNIADILEVVGLTQLITIYNSQELAKIKIKESLQRSGTQQASQVQTAASQQTIQPVTPVAPTQQVQTPTPQQTVQPVTPVAPTQQVQTATSQQTIQPATPVAPTQQVQTPTPQQTVQPVTPVAPTQQVQTPTPQQTVQPVTPVAPTQQVQTPTPQQTVQPITPVAPTVQVQQTTQEITQPEPAIQNTAVQQTEFSDEPLNKNIQL